MDKAWLIAAKIPHGSDWLYMLPIAASGLCLSDEVIQVSVSLHLGLNLCESHACPCGATVTSRGMHGLSFNRSTDSCTCHYQINDTTWQTLKCANVSATKEPTGILRGDGKHPDGLTLVTWQREPSLIWDIIVVDIFWPAPTCQTLQ